MRVDFNGNTYNEDMNDGGMRGSYEKNIIERRVPKLMVSLLGCVSLFFSLLLIPSGFIAGALIEVLEAIGFASIALNFVVAYIVSLLIVTLFASAAAIAAIILYFRESRSKIAKAGLAFACVSILNIILGFGYNLFILLVYFL
jgi:hypothetical protein